MSDYRTALEAAGAEVELFEQFGSYQGDWWARVVYRGSRGWVHGSYGSCSGCDAFAAEFGFVSGHEHAKVVGTREEGILVEEAGMEELRDEFGGEYWCVGDKPRVGCQLCEEWHKRLAQFGERYLDQVMTQEEAELEAGENIEWDVEAKDMLEFLRNKGGVSCPTHGRRGGV